MGTMGRLRRNPAEIGGKSSFFFLFSNSYFKFKSITSLNFKHLLLDAQIKYQHECKTIYIFLYICFILVLLYMIPIMK
jgi:hypothetical protein